MGRVKDEEGRLKSPLFDYYQEEAIKLVDFAGWALPIQYSKIQDEHHSVRNNVGLFEVSHMGEIFIRGEKVIEWFNYLITNDANKCQVNQAQYTAVVNEAGQTLDDLIYYRLSDDEIMVTPNAGNYEKILAWLNDHNQEGQVEIDDQTFNIGLIAVQGPDAEKVLAKLTDTDLSQIKNYHFLAKQEVAKVENVLISRTGYTGEDGFELYIPWDDTLTIWQALLEAGEEFQIARAGLGSRDTLRLEAGMALYGNDITEEINPLEAALSFAVDFNKEDFIGKDALQNYKESDKQRVSRAFELVGKGIARQGYLVFETEESEQPIGEITSGTKSPSLGISLGLVLLDKAYAKLGNSIFIEIRNKRVEAKITKKNWLKRIKEEK